MCNFASSNSRAVDGPEGHKHQWCTWRGNEYRMPTVTGKSMLSTGRQDIKKDAETAFYLRPVNLANSKIPARWNNDQRLLLVYIYNRDLACLYHASGIV